MALTGADRGTGTDSTGATSIGFSPGSNFTVGAMAVLCFGCDNEGGGDPFSSISDSIGNTWTSRVNGIDSPGGADSDGAVLRIFTSPQDVGQITTGTTITIDFGALTVVKKVWAFVEVLASAGVPTYVEGSSNHTGTASTPGITTSSITTGDIVIGACAIESGGAGYVTQDGDTSNGTWSSQQYADGSTFSISSQYKVVTGTATQTYNLILGSSPDREIGWISVTEVIASATDPFGQFGIFGI